MSHLLRGGLPAGSGEDTLVGEAFEVGDRTIYPIMRAFRVNAGNFLWAWISPLAIVVVEPTQKYVVALTDEKFSSDRLLEMVASSKRESKRDPGSKKTKKGR